MNDPTTTDLARFGARERAMLVELLQAWSDEGLPVDFTDDEVRPMLNVNSGYVFLINSEFEVAMLNGGQLESFYVSPYEGREGFYDDLVDEYEDMHPEDQEWLRDIATNTNRDVPGGAS